MTQVGEAVNPALIVEDELACPFDHELEEPPKVDNELRGKGSTLGSRMKTPQGTHLYAAIKARYAPTEPVLNPKEMAGHPFVDKAKVVKIADHDYPVSCAAHHCIPAQESLQGHQILAFMCKKNSSEEANHGYGDGLVWSNVGYDVNGAQNGVYLPGSYAVGGGRGGMKVWIEDTADKENESLTEPPDENSNLLTGPIPGPEANVSVISDGNRKWLYVRQAMKLANAQFHDRHVDYSEKFVKGALKKLFTDYTDKYKGSFRGKDCSKCEKRKEKAEELGIPTPYGLVERLNKIADNCRRHLTADTWPMNVYTSNWVRAWMAARLAHVKDADF